MFHNRTAISTLTILFLLLTLIPSTKFGDASHEVSALPPSGTYNTTQSITLASENPSTIYYTTDGSSPTNESAEYTTPILIGQSTTLKFLAIDNLDAHASSIVTEVYLIDTNAPEVTSTEPGHGTTRVDPRSMSFHVLFNEPMDESTITSDDAITIFDSSGNQISGSVFYNSSSITAIFTADEEFYDGCEECFNIGRLYFATISGNVTDSSGNPMGEDFTFSFRTGGIITINLIDTENSVFVGGSSVELDPDPFDLTGTLIVEDDSEQDLDLLLFEEQIPGRIVIFNAEFETYLANVMLPDGFTGLYENLLITVHDTNRRASGTFRTIPDTSSLDDVPPVIVPPPQLNEEQFALYEGNATRGIFSGIKGTELGNRLPISTVGPNAIPDARLTSEAKLSELIFAVESVVFNITAADTFTGEQLFETFLIPTYPNPVEAIADGAIYVVPAFVIPYESSNNNYVLTPMINKIFPGTTLSLRQASFVEAEVAKVEKFNMTFNTSGNNIGFSFGITDNPPPGITPPPLDAPALFLDVGFVGDVDFSNPDSFASSPKIDILVNKTLSNFPELPNGCPDFRLLFFNGTGWEEVQKLNPSGNFTDYCPFTLEPEHFSKFAVGGVKGTSTEGPPDNDDGNDESEGERDRNRGGGGGGSRSSTVSQPPQGSDISLKIMAATGIVTVHFENIEEGSGQLKVSTNEISAYEEFFDELVFLKDNDEHGVVQLDDTTYSTTGKVYDIDISNVVFRGMVNVAIPYDEKAVLAVSSESDVRLLHYNEEIERWEDVTATVDQESNTVTGLLDSLSPVTAAIIIDKDQSNIGHGPNLRLGMSVPLFSNDNNRTSTSVDLQNLQSRDQAYVLIVQLVDDQGIVQYLDWEVGSLQANSVSTVSMSWSEVKGSYKALVLLLTDLENPWLLADVVRTQFQVS